MANLRVFTLVSSAAEREQRGRVRLSRWKASLTCLMRSRSLAFAVLRRYLLMAAWRWRGAECADDVWVDPERCAAPRGACLFRSVSRRLRMDLVRRLLDLSGSASGVTSSGALMPSLLVLAGEPLLAEVGISVAMA